MDTQIWSRLSSEDQWRLSARNFCVQCWPVGKKMETTKRMYRNYKDPCMDRYNYVKLWMKRKKVVSLRGKRKSCCFISLIHRFWCFSQHWDWTVTWKNERKPAAYTRREKTVKHRDKKNPAQILLVEQERKCLAILPRHSLWSGRLSIMIAFRLFSSILIEFSIVENSSIITTYYRTTFRASQLTSVTTIHRWRKWDCRLLTQMRL